MDKLSLYQAFIREVTNSAGSWENYSQFSRIDKAIKALHPDYKDLIEYDDPEFVQGLYNELIALPELPTEKGTTFKRLGQGQYHNALQTYIKFLKAYRFFHNNDIDGQKSSNENQRDLALQQIYYGAPGTGKSFSIDQLTGKESVIRTTFHPDSDYSTFVGAYKPVMSGDRNRRVRKMSVTALAGMLKDYYEDAESGKIVGIQRFVIEYQNELKGVNIKQLVREAGISENYKVEIDKYLSFCNNIPVEDSTIEYRFVEQAFLQAFLQAWKFYAKDRENPKKQFLVIEEINRGNCAQIFGDLFQLLDRNEQGFSSYEIKPDTDIRNFIAKQNLSVEGVYDNAEEFDISEQINGGELMVLPPNLYIWATMNTSDQSLFPIDSAFKRRWDWKYVPIAKKDENYKIRVKGVDGMFDYDWWNFLEKVNTAIGELTSSEDKKLGYFFCKADQDKIISTDKFVSKVLFYLYNDVFKDYESDDVTFTFNDLSYTLLKYKDGDKEKHFKFPEFFDEKGDGRDNMVQKFLDNIKVEKEIAGTANMDGEEENDSTIKPIRKKFWQGFIDASQNNANYMNVYPGARSATTESFMDLGFGTSLYHPFMTFLHTKSVIRCGIWINESDTAESIYNTFQNHQAEMESLLGESLTFKHSKKAYSINAEKAVDLKDENNWSGAYEWLMEMSIKMKEIKEKFGI